MSAPIQNGPPANHSDVPLPGEVVTRPVATAPLVIGEHGGGLSAAMTIEQQRAIAETQAAMFVAQRNPRDVNAVLKRIERTCSRITLAEIAHYSFPRGQEEISGPSVYLLKAIAQEWGNLAFGIRELSRDEKRSVVQSYAWDMERNVREEKTFDVKHWRDTKSGGYALKDERDIYELIANMGSRRLRACLEGIIPEDVIQYASKIATKAALDAKVNTPETRAELLEEYGKFGVTRERIEKRLGRNFDAVTLQQLVRLRNGLTAIRDGMVKPDEAFPPIDAQTEGSETGGTTDAKSLRDRIANKKQSANGGAPATEPPPEGNLL